MPFKFKSRSSPCYVCSMGSLRCKYATVLLASHSRRRLLAEESESRESRVTMVVFVICCVIVIVCQ